MPRVAWQIRSTSHLETGSRAPGIPRDCGHLHTGQLQCPLKSLEARWLPPASCQRSVHCSAPSGGWRPLLLPGEAPGEPALLRRPLHLPGAAVSMGRGRTAGRSLWPRPGDGGELRLSLHSGVFSDGNLTYIVEPQEVAGPWGAPQVSPTQPLAVLSGGPAKLVPTAVAATSSSSCSSLSNPSLTALFSDPSSGSLPPVPQLPLCPQLQCPICPISDLPLGSNVLCPCLSGCPQVLTPESEHLGDQIRHGSCGQFWVTPGWGGGEGWIWPPPSGPGAGPVGTPRTNFPSLQGPLPHLIYRTPLLPDPLGCREPGKGGKGGWGGAGCAPLTCPSPQAACLLCLPSRLLQTGRG